MQMYMWSRMETGMRIEVGQGKAGEREEAGRAEEDRVVIRRT